MDKVASKKKVEKYSIKATEQRLLRSAVISLVGEDPEGVYRPEFVERALTAARKKPTMAYTSPKAFLTQLRSV